MKLNGPDFQKFASLMTPKDGGKPPRDLADLVRVHAETSDKSDIDPLTRSFLSLADHDRRAPLLEGQRLQGNLKKGFETLVSFEDSQGKEFVLSVRKESEVPLYATLVSGTDDDSEVGRLHGQLKQAANSKFYLERDGKYLRTDEAGAAITLGRGSRLVVKRADGQYETFKSGSKALDFLKSSDPEVAARRAKLEKAEAGGLTYSPMPKGERPNVLGLILEAFKGGGELKVERDLMDSLQRTGKVEVSFENDERPLSLPLALSPAEVELAGQWKDDPTPDIKRFKEDFKALSEDKTLLMTQHTHGDMKGMVVRADDRSAYFQLSQGERVVALDKQGALHELNSLEDFRKFKETGRAKAPAVPDFDGTKNNSDNLMMFYHVSPFDPVEKGNYDDLPLRINEVGSSPQLDIVTMRSDLPDKRNLVVERSQQGHAQELRRIDAETAMSDPKVLEDFVYETVKSNMGDGRIRFLVGGHGGAEKGLLPDGEHNNSAANQAMPVDQFAAAISKALDRVEKETGTRPKIHNLMLVSCLMGNTSLINALAKTGDVETLVASPELMAGSNPISTFEYLADPATSKATGREYAQHLVDEWSQAPAMIGGNKEQHHADTIGAYDLSPEKAQRFEKALGGFFEAALAEPQFAEYLKEGIAKAPTYGINPLINVMFDVDNRDLLQVLDHTSKDARIKSPRLKKAMAELREATEDQVIAQKVSEDYEGRRGPSLYLPLDRWDFSEKMSETSLLKGVKYKEFMEMIFDAPLQRSVAGNLINEVSRISETGALDKAIKKLQDYAAGKTEKKSGDAAKQAGEKAEPKPTEASPEATKDAVPGAALLGVLAEGMLKSKSPEAEKLKELQALEEDTRIRPLRRAVGLAKGALNTAIGVAGGAVAGAIAAVPAAIAGAVLGAKAGWSGVSAAGTAKPASKEEVDLLNDVVTELLEVNGVVEKDEVEETPAEGEAAKKLAEDGDDERLMVGDFDLTPAKKLLNGRVAKSIKQLLLLPSERVGIKTHEAAGYRFGEMPGRVAGAVVGAFSGALFNALAVGGAVFAGGGLYAGFQSDGLLDKVTPGPVEKADSSYVGRYEPSDRDASL